MQTSTLRWALFLGLVIHKVIWEVLKGSSSLATGGQSERPKLPVRIIKGFKATILLGLVIQTLYLDLVPIKHAPKSLGRLGAALYGIGLTTAILGRVSLGPNWANIEDRQIVTDKRLVTRGIYQYVRHPIYAGDLLLLLGLQLALRSWLFLISVAALALVVRQAIAEESLLARTFPHYADYMRRTKRFIPFVF
jgi:protein-S-isoprenylcysteine O-methyltransferase Ste14